jgi:ribosomal protein L21E
MAKFKEGDKVKVKKRPANPQDAALTSYFDHMAGLTGVIENYYSDKEIAVKVDIESLGDVAKRVHKDATKRMRQKTEETISGEQKGQLSAEELKFTPHYMLLVQASDLEKA